MQLGRRGRRRNVLHILVLAMSCALAAGPAAAQLSETERLERCANNRGRIAALRAEAPRYERAWAPDKIAEARRALATFERIVQDRDVPFSDDHAPDVAMVRAMAEVALDYEIICFPFSVSCGEIFISELRTSIGNAERARPEREAYESQLAFHRNNLIALGCDRLDSAANGGVAQPSQWLTGTFDSSFGVMTFGPGGGSYDYQGGRLGVGSIDGNVVEGIWEQTRSGRQCPDGRFWGRYRFEFTAEGFSGGYSYCDGEPGGGWSGTRRG